MMEAADWAFLAVVLSVGLLMLTAILVAIALSGLLALRRLSKWIVGDKGSGAY